MPEDTIQSFDDDAHRWCGIFEINRKQNKILKKQDIFCEKQAIKQTRLMVLRGAAQDFSREDLRPGKLVIITCL